MKKKLAIIQDDCTSCGKCVEQLPQYFRFNDYDLAEVYSQPLPDEDDLQELIQNCPAQCIVWKNDPPT